MRAGFIGRPVAAAAAAALALALAGCADDVGPAQLMTYLPADARGGTAVDLDGARSELELEPDADALDPDLPGLSALVGVAGIGDPVDPAALWKALDGTAISAVAGSEDVAIIATDQSFDEVAVELEGEGYEREGETLVATGEVLAGEAAEIAAAPDGVIVASGEGRSARELAADPPGGPAELIELVSGAGTMRGGVEFAKGRAEGGELDCYVAQGGRQNADGSVGALLIRLDRHADLDRVDADAIADNDLEIDPGLPTVAGPTIEIPFTAPATIPSEDPVGALLAIGAPQAAYPCPPG